MEEPHPPLEVRRATAADLPRILEIDRESVEAPHWSGEMYAEFLGPSENLATSCLLVAVASTTVAGYAAARVVAGEAELETVVVATAARRRGIGAELCRALMGWARQESAGVMNLEVRARSTGAQSLYDRLGFQVVGRRPKYYRFPEDDALLMSIAID